jgi:hypothetical protein
VVGSALGAMFLTFALTLAFGSPLIDAVGMRNVLLICAGSFVSGATLSSRRTRSPPARASTRWVWIGMLLAGIGWGCSEAVINPLTTAPDAEDAQAQRAARLVGRAASSSAVCWRRPSTAQTSAGD